MRKRKPEFPLNRDLSPLTEKEVLDILNKVDESNEKAPEISYAEFLADLYRIVDVLNEESVVTTPQAVEILQLRAKREGFSYKYTKAAVINRNTNGSLYALSPDERRNVIKGVSTRGLLFSLRDVLSVPLGRWPAGHKKAHKPLKFNRAGRPTKAMQEAMRQKREELQRGLLSAANF